MMPLGHMGITLAIARLVEKTCKTSWLDYRWLLFASLLPDLVDKTIGFLFSTEHVSTRTIGHSLIFLLLLSGLGLIQRYYGKYPSGFILFLGAFLHDMFDAMWLYPQTLYWPIHGWLFSRTLHLEWAGTVTIGTVSVPKLVAVEVIGGAALLYLFAGLIKSGEMTFFLTNGRLDYIEQHDNSKR